MNKITLIVIALVLLVLVGGGALLIFNGRNKIPTKQVNNSLRESNKVAAEVLVTDVSAAPRSTRIKKGDSLGITNKTNKKMKLTVSGPLSFVIPIGPGAIIQAPVFGSKTGTYKLEFDTVPASEVTVETVE